MLTLAGLAFVSVSREGLETVLFLFAIGASSGPVVPTLLAALAGSNTLRFFFFFGVCLARWSCWLPHRAVWAILQEWLEGDERLAQRFFLKLNPLGQERIRVSDLRYRLSDLPVS